MRTPAYRTQPVASSLGERQSGGFVRVLPEICNLIRLRRSGCRFAPDCHVAEQLLRGRYKMKKMIITAGGDEEYWNLIPPPCRLAVAIVSARMCSSHLT